MRHPKGPRSMTRAFALNFTFLVIVPLTILVTVFMTLSWRSYHDKAMEGVATLHSAIEELLQDEADAVSMTLSQLVHANNGAIMALASGCDTDDSGARYRAYSQLSEILEYSLKNDSDFIALTFNFDSGRHVSYDSEVGLSQDVWSRHDREDVKENTVDLRAISATSLSDAYQSVSVGDGNMVWSALLVPGPLIDRVGNITSVELLYVSDVYQMISRHDTAYKLGSNSIGYSVLLDDSTGNVLSIGRMDEELLADYLAGDLHFGWTYVSDSFDVHGREYSMLTAVRTADFTGSFMLPILLLIMLILLSALFMAFFSRQLMRNVIRPVKKISAGLRRVEEGDLSLHLDGEGYEEIEQTMHSFNGMVRHQRALIEDYQAKIEEASRSPERLFTAFVNKSLDDEGRTIAAGVLFKSSPTLMIVAADAASSYDKDEVMRHLNSSLSFATDCLVTAIEGQRALMILHMPSSNVHKGPGELSDEVRSAFRALYDTDVVTVWSDPLVSMDGADEALSGLLRLLPLLSLMPTGGAGRLADVLSSHAGALEEDATLDAASRAIFLADQGAVLAFNDGFKEEVLRLPFEEAIQRCEAFIHSFSRLLLSKQLSPGDWFGRQEPVLGRLWRIEGGGELGAFISLLLQALEEKGGKELDTAGGDRITRARRYIAENWRDPGLSLTKVAGYVDLNERYFSTLFSKEMGVGFSAYLSTLRIENAKLLLREGKLRIYEVASLCGWASPEAFNKAFKKAVGIGPMEYRKGLI